MPDLNGMMLFAAVVRAKGFSQAARETGHPKSTISRKIAQLEEQLGVRLLQRDTRNLSLTQVGALFYQHCDSIRNEVEAAKAVIESTHDDVSGSLRIAIPVSFSQELIANLCSGFMRLYPNVELDVQFTDNDIGLVGEGYDIAIKYGPLQSSDLVARLLFERQPILVASPGYSEKLVKKAIEGDALRIGSGDTVKHEEAVSPFAAKLFSNITGSQRYVLIAVRHTQPATVDESRKAAIFHHDIRQAGIAMGHDEILAVGHPRLEPGEQFGWREPLMLFVQIILIDKTGFHPSTCSLDAMFRLVVEWAGSRIKRMQPPHCISHDGYFLGRSKVR